MGLIRTIMNRLQQRTASAGPRIVVSEGSARPQIMISEAHEVATSPGPGVRSCFDCDTMWKSHLGTLKDSGEYAQYQARGDCKIYASWEETIGLTCSGCGRSRCLEHLGQPETAGSVPQAYEYACPSCGEHMAHA